MRCGCPCHCDALGTQRAATDAMDWEARKRAADRAMRYVGVECADPLEAAVACDQCRPFHCDALSSHPTRPPVVTPKAPTYDPTERPESVSDGEGAE